MSKIKVSRGLRDALDSAIAVYEGDVNEILETHNETGWEGKDRLPLNAFGLYEIAQFYIKGYELRDEDKDPIELAEKYLRDWEEVITEHPRNKYENAVEQLKHANTILKLWKESLK